jgi:hypothetical protein
MEYYEQNRLIRSALDSDVEMLKKEIENGSSVDIVNKMGTNLLMYTISFGYGCTKEEYINLLLENKIDINHKTNTGLTALHLACLNSSYNVVKLLLENGADINIVDSNGMDSLMQTCESSYVCFPRLVGERLGFTKEEIDALYYAISGFYREDKKELANNQLNIIKLLLENEVSVNRISNGKTALDLIVDNPYISDSTAKKIIELLKKYDFKLNKNYDNYISSQVCFLELPERVSKIKRLRQINKY